MNRLFMDHLTNNHDVLIDYLWQEIEHDTEERDKQKMANLAKRIVNRWVCPICLGFGLHDFMLYVDF